MYEQFERGQWRDGFRDATQVLEQHAQTYLKKGIRTTRITVLDKTGKIRPLTPEQIDRLTLGQIGNVFANIQTPSQADSLIGQVINLVNPDRVRVSHKKGKGSTEKKLRTNVGKHMWAIASALKLMLT
ncbi:MAG: hypothetical protein ACYCZY_09545 [Lacisediminihabitans sp.]